MKTLSHKAIAIILAAVASLLSLFSILIFEFYVGSHILLYSIIVAGIILFIIYIISFYLIKEYILQKVKPIYKTILSSKTSSLKKFTDYDNVETNIIATTEKEVEEWTKRKLSEIEELKRLEKYRKEYIGNVSHELKTPIFSIQGYIATLLDGGLHDDKINTLYLEKADKVIQRMTSIVLDLDSITRLEAGELVLEYSNFNIIQVIKEVFEAQEYIAKQQNVEMYIDVQDEKPIMVNADRGRIQTVISNLVINAIKYSKVKAGSVRIRFYDMDKVIIVEIADKGIGIEPEDLSRIFERFYRVDKSRSREQGGTGLGLSIVKHIIEAHGQTISVKSVVNKGTSFTFTIEKAKTN